MDSISLLHELAVDLINTAKTSKDSKSKIFHLEQVREIILHRDKTLLSIFLSDIFDFHIEKSAPLRKFLLKFGFEMFEQDSVLTLSHLIGMLNYFMTDTNDSVITLLARELSKYYSKIILALANLQNNPIFLNLNQGPPKRLWDGLKLILTRLNEYISSARSDPLKTACMWLLEEEILFGLPNTNVSSDPRLARKVNDPRLNRTIQKDAGTSTSNASTLEEIPLQHPYMNRAQFQQEAVDLYSKMLTWIGEGGPQNNPFSPNLMAILGQTIASVGTLKPSQSVNAAKAMITLITERTIDITQMSKLEKENLARASHRLLRAATVYTSDPEGNMQKLKTALNTFDIASVSVDTSIIGKKRDASELADEDENETSNETHVNEILKALNEAESFKKQKRDRVTNESTIVSTGGNVITMLFQDVSIQDFTEIASELLTLQSISLEINNKLTKIEDLVGFPEVCVPNNSITTSEMEDFSFLPLLKMFESYSANQENGVDSKSIKLYNEILSRTTFTLTLSSIENKSSVYILPIINSWSKDLIDPLKMDIPTSLTLPRILWIYISFSLQPISQDSHLNQHLMKKELQEIFRQRLQLIYLLCIKLLNFALNLPENEIQIKSEEKNEAEQQSLDLRKNALILYDSILLLVITRMIQNNFLRNYLKDFLFNFPQLPLSCCKILKALGLTGTKGSANKDSIRKNRSVRIDALSLLASLVFYPQEELSGECLTFILWNTIHPDFEVRSRFIDTLKNKLLFKEEWCDDIILRFICHSVFRSVGHEVFTIWDEKMKNLVDYNLEIENSLSQNEDENIPLQPNSYFSLLSYLPKDNQDSSNLIDSNKFKDFFTDSVQENVKISIHILSQLALKDIKFFRIFIELYCAYLCYQEQKPKVILPIEINSETKIEDEALNNSNKEEKTWDLLEAIKSEIKIILPALLQYTRDPVLVFKIVSSVKDPKALKLIEYILQLMVPDFTVLPKQLLVEEIFKFVNKSDTFHDVDDDAQFRLFLPVIGGLSSNAIELALPRIIKLFNEDLDNLKDIFSRIIKVRPPVIARAKLLALIHRIDADSTGLKPKMILDAIALCMNNKSDYTSDIIKESLRMLLEDEIPTFALMRTAILAAKSYIELKKFVLADVIPAMIKKSVWSTSPKTWEGVIFCVKNLIESSSTITKPSETAMRSLLAIPGSQLKSVVKALPNIKPLICKLIKDLNTDEKDEIFSGKEFGLNSDYQNDPDKLKAIQEILNSSSK